MEKQENTRRNFLKNMLYGGLSVAVSSSLLSTLSGCHSNDQNDDAINDDNTPSKLPLKKKPIHLGYKEIVEDKDIAMINFPGNKWSMEARIARCLRRKPVTDAVEDRYHIPRGLLMAMMAQEGMGDPTMPNLPWKNHIYGDGGLGLIHIQAVNAHDFGLKTLPRYTREMCDDKHAKLVVEAIKNTKGDLPSLLIKDDRFHPIMAVDGAARFLMNEKKKAGKGTDSRIRALRGYSGRSYGGARGYGHFVIQYRAAINYITGDGFPKNLSRSIKTDIKNATKKGKYIKEKLNTLKFSIDGQESGYSEYLAYFEESMKNFELERYVALGDSIPSNENKDIAKLPQATQEEIKKPQRTRSNSLIKDEFVNTRQHNSEGFVLFRYKVQSGDNALKLSDKFDERDKKRGDKYKNTGDRNIVNFKGEPVKKLTPGDVVYIKARLGK